MRGSDLSLAMVLAGWAVVRCRFARELKPGILATLQKVEADARAAKLGM